MALRVSLAYIISFGLSVDEAGDPMPLLEAPDMVGLRSSFTSWKSLSKASPSKAGRTDFVWDGGVSCGGSS